MPNPISGSTGTDLASHLTQLQNSAIERESNVSAAEKKAGLSYPGNVESRKEKSADFDRDVAAPEIPSPGNPPNSQTQQSAVTKIAHFAEPGGMTDVFLIMAEFHKLSMAMRDASKGSAHAALQAQVTAIQNQADHMRQSAKWALAAAIMSGVASMAAGAFQMGGMAAGWNKIGVKGGAELIGGEGKIFEGLFNMGSQNEQAAGTEAQASAAKMQGEREEIQKFRDGMQENMRAVVQALQQIMQSREQTMAKIFV